jgi:hypothetical protein
MLPNKRWTSLRAYRITPDFPYISGRSRDHAEISAVLQHRRGKTRHLAGDLRTRLVGLTECPQRPGDGLMASAPRAPLSPGRRRSSMSPRSEVSFERGRASRDQEPRPGSVPSSSAARPDPRPRAGEPDRTDRLRPGPMCAGPPGPVLARPDRTDPPRSFRIGRPASAGSPTRASMIPPRTTPPLADPQPSRPPIMDTYT